MNTQAMKELNPEASEILGQILGNEPEMLTVDEAAFLRARRGYLTSDERKRFESVLEVKEPKKKEEKPGDVGTAGKKLEDEQGDKISKTEEKSKDKTKQK